MTRVFFVIALYRALAPRRRTPGTLLVGQQWKPGSKTWQSNHQHRDFLEMYIFIFLQKTRTYNSKSSNTVAKKRTHSGLVGGLEHFFP